MTLQNDEKMGYGANLSTPVAGYAPGRLLDALKTRLRLRSDAELSRFLQVGAPLVSKMRGTRCGLSAGFLIRAQEACGLEIAVMRRLCGDRRKGIRIENRRRRGAAPIEA